MPVSPAAASSCCRRPGRRGVGRGASAPAEPLRQISSSPTPEQRVRASAHGTPSRAGPPSSAARSKPARRSGRRAAGSRRRGPAGRRGVVKTSAVSMTSPSTRPGTRDDLAHPALPARVGAEVHDEVDAARPRSGRRTPCRHVLAGQQRQRAHLDHAPRGRVGVQRAHAGQAAVQRDQQVEALLLPHLADDRSGTGRIRSASLTRRRSGISPVPSRFGCRVCMRDDVGQRHPQLEDLLAR